MISGSGMLGGELGAERLDRALGIEDFADAHADEIELNGQSLGEQARVAARHARAAALAHADIGDAERLQSAQRVARDDAANPIARRQVLSRCQCCRPA